jgi:hypothetical protein
MHTAATLLVQIVQDVCNIMGVVRSQLVNSTSRKHASLDLVLSNRTPILATTMVGDRYWRWLS